MREDMQALRNRLLSFLGEDQYFAYKQLVLFGAGNTYLLYEKSIQLEGLDFACILDNDPQKQGKSFNGKMIYTPSAYMSQNPSTDETLVLIVSNSAARMAIKDELDSLGLHNMQLDEYVLRRHKNEILQVFDLLCDNLSKETYVEVLLTRAGRYNTFPLKTYSQSQYYAFPAFEPADKNDIYVDLGAYVGDTVETYIWKNFGIFKKIYAFEPEARNAGALRIRFERLKREWAINDEKLEIVQAGIGRNRSVLYAAPSDEGIPSLGTILQEHNVSEDAIPVYSIDEFFAKRPERVTYIKADIESFEYDMLCGAEQTIRRYAPRMAICVYHGVSDLYTIPLLVHQYRPDYKLSIRHHSMSMAETILYAYL